MAPRKPTARNDIQAPNAEKNRLPQPGPLQLHGKTTFSRPLLVLAFPTVGGVGAIAARFLIEQLRMPLVGSITSRSLPGTVLIHRGHVEPGVSVYGKDCVCGPKGICQALLVVTSTVPIEGEAVWDVAEAVHHLIDSYKVVLTVALEGQAIEEPREPAAVYTFARGPNATRIARELPLQRVLEGALAGVTGALLARVARHRPDVLVLAAEAHAEYLDPRAAAALMKILSDHFVHTNLDLAPLLEEAKRLETEIRLQETSTNRADRQAGESLSAMYG